MAADSAFGAPVGHQVRPGLSALRCCKVRSPILPAPITSTVLSANVVEDLAGHVHRHAGDRELPLVHAGPFPHGLADAECSLEHGVKDRSDGLPATAAW